MKIRFTHLLVLLVLIAGCDTIFGSKQDDTTDEIFDVGRIDPALEKSDGYVPLLPFWGEFDRPTDVYVGFDEFVYVTDAEGLHLLDRADLSPRRTLQFEGAVSVTQDRLLNVYVAARIDTVIEELDPNISWNLAAVFKIQNLNGAGSGNPVIVDTLIHPFADASRSSTTAKRARLVKGSETNDELVEITGLSVLADNTLYVTRRGPLNNTTAIAAPDNAVLEFVPVEVNGEDTDQMRNVNQLRSLSPVSPNLISAIGMTDIQSFVAPPQRDFFPENKSFLISQGDQNTNITFRVLQINVVETPDGFVYEPNSEFLERDTSRADSFLYDENKFQNPSGIAYAGDETGYIFVVDKALHKVFQFQPNGDEGVTPPIGAEDRSKTVNVSFGQIGNGPREFNSPEGVAYFDEVLYIADTGNNRIARYKLSTDLE